MPAAVAPIGQTLNAQRAASLWPVITQLLIRFHLGADQSIGEALEGLPHYSRESFAEDPPQCWRGDFVISCPVAPELAEGDFVDDFAPHFRALLTLKSLYDAQFELQSPSDHQARCPSISPATWWP
jgi:hypothetical protein